VAGGNCHEVAMTNHEQLEKVEKELEALAVITASASQP